MNITQNLHTNIVLSLDQEDISFDGSFCSEANQLILIYFENNISLQISGLYELSLINNSGVFYSFLLNQEQSLDSLIETIIAILHMFV